MVARCSVLDGPGLGLTKCAEALQCHDWNYFSTLHIHTHTQRLTYTLRKSPTKEEKHEMHSAVGKQFCTGLWQGQRVSGRTRSVWLGYLRGGRGEWVDSRSYKTAWAEQLIKRQRGAFSYLLHNILLFITSRRLGHATSCTIFLNPELLFQLDCQSCRANEMLLGG